MCIRVSVKERDRTREETSTELVDFVEKVIYNNNPINIARKSVLSCVCDDSAIKQQENEKNCAVLKGDSFDQHDNERFIDHRRSIFENCATARTTKF